jgi:glycosyltransferase involved in cell wall biosynthesis
MSNQRPLRIAFVSYRGNMNCGGQGIYLWFLARELAKRGHQVDVFVGPPYPDPMPFAQYLEEMTNEQFWGRQFDGKPGAPLLEPNPLRIFEPLNFYEFAATRFGFLPEPFAFSLRSFHALSKRVKQGQNYDIIHDVQCLGYGLLGMRALGIPVVTTVHHPLSVDRRASFRRDVTFRDALGTQTFYPLGMQSFVARHIDGVLTSSEVSARRIHLDYKVPTKQIINVGNGLDTSLFCPDESVERSETELLCIGRASDPNKGIVTLVEALAQLPSQIRLTLIDSDHPGNVARVRARELGCEDRIRFTGRVPIEELVRQYRRAAIVVVPSLYEGFGLPAAEAMACGAPVVATRAGALPELMQRGQGGVLVPRGDADGIAQGIRELLDNPEQRKQYGEQARKNIVDSYSWPHVAGVTEEVYRQIIAKQHRG